MEKVIEVTNLTKEYKKDSSTPYMIRYEDKCIKCNRCVAVCDKVQKLNIIVGIFLVK